MRITLLRTPGSSWGVPPEWTEGQTVTTTAAIGQQLIEAGLAVAAGGASEEKALAEPEPEPHHEKHRRKGR